MNDGKVAEEMMEPNFERTDSGDPSRVVIASGDTKLAELHAAFSKAQGNGQPLVYCGEYSIIDNKRFGVREYENAKICWVYLDRTESWIAKLKTKPNPALERAIQWRKFPHYSTFSARIAYIIRLKPRDANTLSNLTAWTVISQHKAIGPKLGLPPGNEEACDRR